VRILRGDYKKWPQLGEPTWLTVGVFDGVHRGHQSILAALRRSAKGGTTGVITFAQHPVTVLDPGSAPAMLTSLEQRLELFAEHDVDVAAVLDFVQVRELSPEAFVRTIMDDILKAAHVAVGHGFRFGHRMAGDESLLRDLGTVHDYSVEILEIMGGASPVSSTAIRNALADGRVAEAATMLGRPFQLRGAVVAGDRRGRQLGFPTANLELGGGRAIPSRGVYSALTYTTDGAEYPSVVNIGVRPTFGGMTEVVEVHLLDENINLYGRQLSVDFAGRIRPERRFDGVEELVEQIGRDVAVARTQLDELR